MWILFVIAVCIVMKIVETRASRPYLRARARRFTPDGQFVETPADLSWRLEQNARALAQPRRPFDAAAYRKANADAWKAEEGCLPTPRKDRLGKLLSTPYDRRHDGPVRGTAETSPFRFSISGGADGAS
jgi:hypothetical protein